MKPRQPRRRPSADAAGRFGADAARGPPTPPPAPGAVASPPARPAGGGGAITSPVALAVQPAGSSVASLPDDAVEHGQRFLVLGAKEYVLSTRPDGDRSKRRHDVVDVVVLAKKQKRE